MARIWIAVAMLAVAACDESTASAAAGFSLAEIHQLTSNFVTGCAVQHAWLDQYTEQHGHSAVVRVRGLTNVTGEELDTAEIVRIVVDELTRNGAVEVAPATEPADFLLTGSIAYESDRDPDALLGQGHRRYIVHLAVASTVDGRQVCSATGAIIRWFDR